MAVRYLKKLSLIFIFFFLIFNLQSNISRKVFAEQRPTVDVFFAEESKSCANTQNAITKVTGGEKILKFCIKGQQNILVNGFDFEIKCGGSVKCNNIEEGPDALKFGETLISFNNPDENTFKGTKFVKIFPIAQKQDPVQNPTEVAKLMFNINETGAGSIIISKADVFYHDSSITDPSQRRNYFASRNIKNVTANQVDGGGGGDDGTPDYGSKFDPNYVPDGTWVQDADVTFAGKMAARANGFLGWTFENYEWSKISPAITDNPFNAFWSNITRIIYAFALLLVLVSAFVMIITRGRSITVMRFIPRFILILLLITFSSSFIQFIYQLTDIIQLFFLRRGEGIIVSTDLLNMDFNYQNFTGYRVSGAAYDESVFVSLLLVKISALTFYIMSGILLVRKVILWFFVLVSPVFPLLLLYKPVRNTAKIWIGEFFRWVLYAPIFALFLSGLVTFWQSQNHIPLIFDSVNNPERIATGDPNSIDYPTAINILIGGPGQDVSKANSLNLADTFIYYIVALFMLWAVIILPFILLRIFLDYILTLSFSESSVIKQVINSSFPYLNRYGIIKGPQPSPSIPPHAPPGFGMARTLPFINKLTLPAPAPGELKVDQKIEAVTPQVNRNMLGGKNPKISELTVGKLFAKKILNVPRADKMPTAGNVSAGNVFSETKTSSNYQTDKDEQRFYNTQSFGAGQSMSIPVSGTNKELVNRTRDILGLVDISVPTIKDIARFETSLLSSSVEKQKEAREVIGNLEKIVNPVSCVTPSETHQYNIVRDQLLHESNNNNSFASSVLFAATKVIEQKETAQVTERLIQVTNPETIKSDQERERYREVKEQLTKESSNNNSFASTILSQINTISKTTDSKEKQSTITNSLVEKLSQEKQKGDPLASKVLSLIAPEKAPSVINRNNKQSVASKYSYASSISGSVRPVDTFPAVNRLQTVNLEDYETVKNMWKENYEKLEVPEINGIKVGRKEWIDSDISKITETINLLTSRDPQKIKEGMDMVGLILPFLLIGGFSQTEIIAYLKAKLNAGKVVLENLNKEEEEEETQVSVDKKAEEKPKEMTAEQAADQKSEAGQASVFIVFALLIGGLLLFQFADKTPTKRTGASTVCVEDPNSGPTYNHNGEAYRRIRGATAMPVGEIDAHLETLDGKVYKSTGTDEDYNDPGEFDLIFVDITSTVSQPILGFKYFDIYLKEGKGLPDFIKEFCDLTPPQPLTPREIIPDAQGKSFPPVSFNSAALGDAGPGDKEYFLFSYEGRGSKSWNITIGSSIAGALTVEANGITKRYATYYNNGSTIQYIALVDEDASHPDHNIAYKYTTREYLGYDPSVVQSPAPSFGKPNSLQLRTFSSGNVYPWGWWSPECKPAIYLYPKEKTNVHVKVDPKGYLTYTDPKYPEDGWQVMAYPNGRIEDVSSCHSRAPSRSEKYPWGESGNPGNTCYPKSYDYLYYESKIRDSEIDKPVEGFVVAFNDLPKFYDHLLPKLGLNEKETKDFKDYWEKVLPKSRYYFLGIMSDRAIEKIEPLTVNPKPESVIRVRLYFEALDEFKFVKAPVIKTPQRQGYSLVEWGGMVKVDKDHPFTCSQ